MKDFYLQIKVNKCTTKSGIMSHIALCIVKYIHEKTELPTNLINNSIFVIDYDYIYIFFIQMRLSVFIR